MSHEHEGRGPEFVSDPKPANFDALAAAWDDPVRFHVEVAKYRAQITEYHRARREARA